MIKNLLGLLLKKYVVVHIMFCAYKDFRFWLIRLFSNSTTHVDAEGSVMEMLLSTIAVTRNKWFIK